MRKRIDWSEWDHLLGTKIDYEIAKQIGCEAPTVAKRRFKLKIKPFNSAPPKINWEKYDHQLGSMPDRELAKKIKCSATSVSRRRRKLNITIYMAENKTYK